MGKIVLFYKYISIEYPKRLLKWQKKICSDLGLKGRILIAHEGINATLGGSSKAIDQYIHIMQQHNLFSDIDFKISDGEADYFPRLEIKVKDEVVRLGIDPEKLTSKNGGIHLKPEQVHKLIAEHPQDLLILDARNDYESRIGAFEGAIKPQIDHFREFPAFIDDNIDSFKNKRVLMYCTGGIRCERATAYLQQKGVAKEVMQIEGGIVRYAEKYPNGFFKGKNYVFDQRIAIRVTNDILTHCDVCKVPCDDYTNCLNAECNEHYISCKACLVKYNNTCSADCFELVETGKVKMRPPFKVVPEQRQTSSKK